MASSNELQEAEIREQLRQGGHIRSLLVVERPALEGERPDYVVYMRPSWTRGYRILRTWRNKSDRTFRDFDRLLHTVRDLGYAGPVTVYRFDCPDLARFRGVLFRDGGTKENPKDDTLVFYKYRDEDDY